MKFRTWGRQFVKDLPPKEEYITKKEAIIGPFEPFLRINRSGKRRSDESMVRHFRHLVQHKVVPQAHMYARGRGYGSISFYHVSEIPFIVNQLESVSKSGMPVNTYTKIFSDDQAAAASALSRVMQGFMEDMADDTGAYDPNEVILRTIETTFLSGCVSPDIAISQMKLILPQLEKMLTVLDGLIGTLESDVYLGNDHIKSKQTRIPD